MYQSSLDQLPHVFDVDKIKASAGETKILVTLPVYSDGYPIPATMQYPGRDIPGMTPNGRPWLAVTYAFEKINGIWELKRAAPGGVGSSGVQYSKRAGDGSTPGGVYTLSWPFGRNKDPGSGIQPYHQLSPATDFSDTEEWWIGQDDSPYYNQWRTAAEILANKPAGIDLAKRDEDHWGEALYLVNPAYNYSMLINYNTDPVVPRNSNGDDRGHGSAIFMHQEGSRGRGNTAGCVSMNESDMIFMMQFVTEGTKIAIAQSVDALLNTAPALTVTAKGVPGAGSVKYALLEYPVEKGLITALPIGTSEDIVERLLKRADVFEKNPVNALGTDVPSGPGWLVAVQFDENGLAAIGQAEIK